MVSNLCTFLGPPQMQRLSKMTRYSTPVVFVLALLASVLCGRLASAATGGFTTLTYGDPRKGSALKLEIDDSWVVGDGYRPIRIRITPIGRAKFRKDRQVTVSVDSFHNPPMTPRELTSQVIDLPEGAGSVTTTIYASQNRVQRSFRLQFWEGQRTSRNVLGRNLSRGMAGEMWNESAPAILFLDYDAPAFSQIGGGGLGVYRTKQYEELKAKIVNPTTIAMRVRGVWPVNLDKKTFGDTWVDVVEKIPTLSIITPADLPENWIGLTSVDVIYVSLTDLQRLNEESPTRFQSLESWLRAGGVLWISDLGEKFDRIDQVAELITLSKPPSNEPADDKKDDRMAGWVAANKGLYGKTVKEWRQQNNNGYQWVNGAYVQVKTVEEKMSSKELKERRAELGTPFVWRDVQMGSLVLFEEADPVSSEDNGLWNWVFRTLGPARWMNSRRNGFSPIRENEGFWNFLIPGVGLAPVNSFRVIITLFVLIIGPINYTMLKRRNRLNWMLFTVPAAALLITLGLVGYAMLTDGASVKSRIRSVTSVDQTAEYASTWARQSYYAGIAPSRGIAFDNDVVVLPVDYDPVVRLAGFGQARRARWEDEGYRLERGFLNSRTTAQFMVKRSRPSSIALEWNRDENGKLLGATNRLQSKIVWLLVHDEDGNIYEAENVEDGDRLELTLVDPNDMAAKIRKWVLDKTPVVPEGVDVNLISRQRNRGQTWQYTNQNSHLAGPSFATSRMESLMSGIRIYSVATTNASQTETQPSTARYGGIDKKSYLAVMEKNPEVPVGFAKMTEFESFYLIVGRW